MEGPHLDHRFPGKTYPCHRRGRRQPGGTDEPGHAPEMGVSPRDDAVRCRRDSGHRIRPRIARRLIAEPACGAGAN